MPSSHMSLWHDCLTNAGIWFTNPLIKKGIVKPSTFNCLRNMLDQQVLKAVKECKDVGWDKKQIADILAKHKNGKKNQVSTPHILDHIKCHR